MNITIPMINKIASYIDQTPLFGPTRPRLRTDLPTLTGAGARLAAKALTNVRASSAKDEIDVNT
jgi:hypothetical protein